MYDTSVLYNAWPLRPQSIPMTAGEINPSIFRTRLHLPWLDSATRPNVAAYLRTLDLETVEALVEEASDPSLGDRATELVVSQLLKASDRLSPLMAQCLVASIVWIFVFLMLANAAHQQPDIAEEINNVYGVSAWDVAAPPAGFVLFLMRQFEAQEKRRREDDT